MRKSRFLSVVLLSMMLASIFAVYSIGSMANAAIVTPSVDTGASSNKIQFATNPTTMTITTSTTQEVIYASSYSKTSGKDLGISSTPSLTWHFRGGGNTTGSNGEIAAWWAVSPIAQTVTITFTGSSTGGCVMSAFCVKNADPTSPFDPNLASAGYNYGSSTSASASISTTNPTDLVVSVMGIVNNKQITVGGSYTQINNTGTGNAVSGADEQLQVSTKGTYSPDFTIASPGPAWVEVADAFVPASQSVTVTSSPQTGSGFITVNGTAQSTPYTASFTPGTVLALSATGTVSGGTGIVYIYSSWSDSGAQTHYYTVQSSTDTVTANYRTQYRVTFTQTGLDSSTATGVILTVNGTSVQYSSLPYYAWVNSGDRLVYSYNSTVSSTTSGKQFAVGTISPTSPLTGISSPQTVTANYQTQYQVSFNVSPSGSGIIDKSSAYYNADSLSITASANDGYAFDHWSSDTGSLSFDSTTDASTTLHISGNGVVTANFVPTTLASSLTVSINATAVNPGSDIVNVTGTLTSLGTPLSGKTVTISYFNGTDWLQIGTTSTASDGTYQYPWSVPGTMPVGQILMKSDFAGDIQYLPSSSTTGGTISLQVLPEYSLGGIVAFVVCFAAFIFYRNRKKPSLNLDTRKIFKSTSKQE